MDKYVMVGNRTRAHAHTEPLAYLHSRSQTDGEMTMLQLYNIKIGLGL